MNIPEHCFNIGIPKPNSRRSSLPSVSEVPYMEGFIYLQAEVAHCSWKDCMELRFFHESLLTVTREHVLKMNVVLIKECLQCFLKQEMHLLWMGMRI